MVKKTNPSTPTQSKTKDRWEEYRQVGSWKMVPYNDAALERLANEIYEWASKDEDALVLEEFYLKRGISCSTWIRFKERSPALKEAHNHALRLIGIRREKGAIKSKMDFRAIASTQPRYSKTARQVEEWRANLRAKANEDSDKLTNVKVVIEKYDDTK